ncbi:MAG: hypothetical protein A2X64_06365 [Ignavibacteria bacterium GWF2_33_9]|nr:MAG: hypothetical protein A2X64_06365 [Ignavibacteria bacterium GWF2_33_9]
MKKFITLILIVFAVTINSNAQELDSFTAKDAYNYLNSIGALTDMNLVMTMSMEMPNQGVDYFTVDFTSGKSTNWTFTCVSTDPNNKKVYSATVLKMAGTFVAMGDSTDDELGETRYLNEINWVDSDVIGVKVAANTSLMTFLNNNSANVYFKYFILAYSNEEPAIDTFTWLPIMVTNSNTTAACMYNAVTGQNITCEIDGVVNVEEIQKSIVRNFPNPTTGLMNFNTELTGNAQIRIFDLSGIEVSSFSQEINRDFQLNLSNLSNGFYNIVITTESGSFSKKVIIAK